MVVKERFKEGLRWLRWPHFAIWRTCFESEHLFLKGTKVSSNDNIRGRRLEFMQTDRRGSRGHTEDGRFPIAEQPATGLHGLTGRPPAGSRRTQNERCTTALCPRFRLTGTSLCSGVAHGPLYAAATVATEGNVYRVGHAGGQRSTVGSRLPLSRTRCPMICST